MLAAFSKAHKGGCVHEDSMSTLELRAVVVGCFVSEFKTKKTTKTDGAPFAGIKHLARS